MMRFCLYILVTCISLISCDETHLPPTLIVESARIGIAKSNSKMVGDNVTIKTTTATKTQQPATLLLDNGLTIKTLTIQTNRTFSLDPILLQQAGLYKLTLVQHNQIIATAQFTLEADVVIEPLEVYTGPVTILVNDQEESMLTYIPSDKYGNGITSDLLIDYKTSKGILTFLTDTVQNLISYKKLSADIKAEKIILGVAVDSLSSSEQVVDKIADWPESIELSIVQHHPYADNRQFTRLKTQRLIDQYGNQIADGTIVIVTQNQDNKTIATYKCMVIDGVANAYLRNPNSAGNFHYQASIGPILSDKLTLSFARLVNEIPTSYDNKTRLLSVGPITSSLGQLVPDGTEVVVTYGDQKKNAETVDGKVIFTLEKKLMLVKTLTILAGGLEKTVDL